MGSYTVTVLSNTDILLLKVFFNGIQIPLKQRQLQCLLDLIKATLLFSCRDPIRSLILPLKAYFDLTCPLLRAALCLVIKWFKLH